jgi:hypothetical protein
MPSKSPAREAASPSGAASVSHCRCIISFRDAHHFHSHPHLSQETPHLQIAEYLTVLKKFSEEFISISFDEREFTVVIAFLVVIVEQLLFLKNIFVSLSVGLREKE